LREALASSIISYPWTKSSKSSNLVKKVKKNIKKALKATNVFVQIRETSMACVVLGCGNPIVKYEPVCDTLSDAIIAFTTTLKK